MNQQTIDKLMEVKKLHDNGILTKEEMEAEKKKVLQSDTPDLINDKPIASKKKFIRKPWAILLIVGLVAIGGWYGYIWYLENVYYYAPSSSFNVAVEGIQINDRYDTALEKLQADPSNKERGIIGDPDRMAISVFQKSFYGVTFDYVYFNFSFDAVHSIVLRKVLNNYDNNPQKNIDKAYSTISKELREELHSVVNESSNEISFRDGCSIIKVCKSKDGMTDEYELTVTIEGD